MTMRGIARGRIIELDQPLPYPDGQEINISVDKSSPEKAQGSGAAILQALRSTPPIDAETMDRFDRIVRESKRPSSQAGVFDDLRHQ